MRSYFALAPEDFFFLKQAAARTLPGEFTEWPFKRIKNGYLPKDTSLLEPETTQWYRSVLAARQEGKELNLRQYVEQSLLGRFVADHIFIPMTYSIAHTLSDSRLPFITPETLAGTAQDWAVMQRTAMHAFNKLAQRIVPQRLNWSYNWLALHTVFAYWFFAPIELAFKMGQKIRNEGGTLTCVANTQEHFSHHLVSYELFRMAFRQSMGDGLREITYANNVQYEPYPVDHIDYSVLKGSVIFTGIHSTAARHYPLVAETAVARHVVYGSYSRCFTPNQMNADFAEGIIRFPGLSLLPWPAPAVGERKAIQQATDELADLLEGCLSYDTAGLRQAAHFIATFCWRVEDVYRKLLDVFSRYRPSICLGEANNGCECAAVLYAAKDQGISTVGLLHSYAPNLDRVENLVITDRYALSHPLAETMILKRVPKYEVMSFTQLSMENEYSTDGKHPVARVDGKINIMIVLSASMVMSPLAISTADQSRLDWIAALNAVPGSIADKVCMRFKMHPRFHSIVTLQAAGVRAKNILHPQTTMMEALEATDLLISCNYWGGRRFMPGREECLSSFACPKIFYWAT